jgi:methionyl-tRNA formyltransferase
MANFGLMAVGYKGLALLKSLKKHPKFVVSYESKEKDTHQQIIDWCVSNKVDIYARAEFNQTLLDGIDKLFLVGWQFLVSGDLEKYFVLHDSYLPERRGFCPTVSALLDGEDYVGASCFCPIEGHGPDYGIVFGREKKFISHPLKIQAAFDLVVELYVGLIDEVLRGDLKPIKIDYEGGSSFSVWRDEQDYKIDWSDSAEIIHRKICANGYPYDGATTIYEGDLIYITESIVESDVNILNRQKHFGKIWKVEEGNPTVICGSGLLKVVSACNDAGGVAFALLRKRFS